MEKEPKQFGTLCLTIRLNDEVVDIHNGLVQITVKKIKHGQARLTIKAPKEIKINRVKI